MEAHRSRLLDSRQRTPSEESWAPGLQCVAWLLLPWTFAQAATGWNLNQSLGTLLFFLNLSLLATCELLVRRHAAKMRIRRLMALWQSGAAVSLLAFFDLTLAALCLSLCLPAWLLQRACHAQQEIRTAIARNSPTPQGEIEGGRPVRCCWIATGMLHLFTFGILISLLVGQTMAHAMPPGQLIIVMGYVLLFAMGLSRALTAGSVADVHGTSG